MNYMAQICAAETMSIAVYVFLLLTGNLSMPWLNVIDLGKSTHKSLNHTNDQYTQYL